ncbi:Peroxiredoxin-5, mitochondrial [Dufourea novaeangliae]|uniref:Peroxiredoxin-5 n=1 Tax=Dufourea novaeangliae TaxID=178035 RepID=A0A154PCS5_DUFNO|nr:Peroxiredoxin-5, mitochondrial [Dufourea novaeangliae]
MPRIRIGDSLPNVTLYEDEPDNRIDILNFVANKRAIIFGIPGAFVPGCSRVHLRGFIEKSDDLRYLGFQEIICVSVNDPYVMSAWGSAKAAEDKVRMLADPLATYTRAIGMDIEIPELGGIRSRRYSMATVNGIVRELFVDSPNVKLMCLQQDGVPTYCT